MKRIEKTLLHNPDLCPFGLVAQGGDSGVKLPPHLVILYDK